MDLRTILIVLLVLACIIGVAFLLLGGVNESLVNVIYELETCQKVGLLMQIPQDKLPPEFQQLMNEKPKRFDSAIMAIYIDLITGKTIPEDGWGLVYAGVDDFAYDRLDPDALKYVEDPHRFGTRLANVSVIGQGYMPTIGSQESGTKYYLQITGLRGVSDTGYEVGQIIDNPDYNPNFNPASGTPDIWQKSSCIFRIVTGRQSRDAPCMEYGFLPYTNWVRVGPGPSPSPSGVYEVNACNTGLWMSPVATTGPGLSTMYTTDPETASLIETALQNLNHLLHPVPVAP